MKKASRKELSPLLHLTYVLQHVSDKNLLPAVGVGLGQIRIMSVLHNSTDVAQNHIAHTLAQTEANVSRQLQQMKRRGLVSIRRNKRDGRQRHVGLTAKGNKAYKTAMNVLAAQERELLKLLGKKDLKSFDNVLNNLLSALNIHTRKRL